MTVSDDDLLLVIVRRWRTFLCTAAFGCAAALTYAFLAPPWFDATLTVIQSQRSHESAAMSLAAKLPGAFDAISTDVQRIDAVLTSNSVSDAVIEKFKLDDRYGTSHREQTRSALWSHCRTHVDHKSGIVALTCEDKNPQTAAAIAAYFGEVGNQVFARVSGSSAREEEKFLEAQVAKARTDVDTASAKLRDFQEQHKIVDLSEQSKAVISAMASLEGDLLSKQLELSYVSGFSSAHEASVTQLQQQITIMQAKLAELQTQSPSRGSGVGSSDFFPSAMKVPELQLQLEQLLRELKVRETVFAMLTQRYEMARVEAARDTSTFQILDHPSAATYRARPRRGRMGVIGIGLGLLVGAGWVLVPLWWRRRMRRAGS